MAEPLRAAEASGNPLYAIDFEKAALDSVPDDFLILDGGFAVKEENGNKFLELPGAPLETFGALFGPAEKANLSVSARVLGTGKGRRFPTLAVGLSGVGGYKLQISPAKKQLELYRGEHVVANINFEWESGKWYHHRLQVRQVKEGEWKVEGRTWLEGQPEPQNWLLSFDEKEEPVNGKASVWGSPFSGTPIRFDDFKVEAVTPKP